LLKIALKRGECQFYSSVEYAVAIDKAQGW